MQVHEFLEGRFIDGLQVPSSMSTVYMAGPPADDRNVDVRIIIINILLKTHNYSLRISLCILVLAARALDHPDTTKTRFHGLAVVG